MGLCVSKPSSENPTLSENAVNESAKPPHSSSVNGGTHTENGKKSPFFPFYSPSPAHYLFSKKSPARSPAPAGSESTPRRFFKRPFPPPSPAKHIRAVLARRQGSVKPNEASIPEGSEAESEVVVALDKSFGFSKHFGSKYELGSEVGRGHFGYTCAAKLKKGEHKGHQVAVKVIPKAKVWSKAESLYL